MKVYPFIVINKSNMTEVFHFATVEDTAHKICNHGKHLNLSNWIVVKNEKTVIDLTKVSGGDWSSIYRGLKNLLETP